MSADPFSEFGQQRLIRVKNASGETIPACAAMRITGLDADDKSLRTVDKPNADSQTDLIVFNGPTEIAVPVTNDENEESGHGQGFADVPVLALCYASDPEPANNDSLGTASGQWELRAGKAGFKVEGNSLTTTAGKYAQVGKAAPIIAASGARIYATPATSIVGDGALNVVSFPSVQFDTDGYYSGGAPTRLTIPADGLYLVGANLYLSSLDDSLGTEPDGMYWSVEIGLDGSFGGTHQVASGYMNKSHSNNAPLKISMSAPYVFVSGDYIQLGIAKYPGGTTGFYADFWIVRQ